MLLVQSQHHDKSAGAFGCAAKRNDLAFVLVEKSICLHAAGPAIVLNERLIPLDKQLGAQDEGLIGKGQQLEDADELIGGANNKQVGTNELLGIADK
jgi:hypothetical protein